MSKIMSFEKVLVANRGEIALRIIRTLKKMNIKSVAVYSEADTNAQHVQQADEAYYIGESPATESYLSIKNILAAIQVSGAQAVHPGYGFLSENVQFANSLKREGIGLIGPSARVIKQMGDKVEAKKIAESAGVSTIPGYMGVINNTQHALKIAEDIGFPIIIKAAAGGGGRGMRVVNNKNELEKAYISAKYEAQNCFNDSRVFIEKLIKNPRHIEIQVLADEYGNIVCLGERECSIQRYHQKIIEEAPSVFVDNVTRERMYEEVNSLTKKVGYSSAGTVEFMMDNDKNYYFLEMNTRLQVEHTVTELITGIDIVEQMVNIANSQKLPFKQEDIKMNGWAIETRICAEDPKRGFLPSSGRILDYSEPPKTDNVRVDSGVHAGCEVSMYYDAMLAKLCTYARDRDDAIRIMKESLGEFIIKGIAHNISFLEVLINHPRFIKGDINTGFIEEEYPSGFSGAHLSSEINEIFIATASFLFLTEQVRYSSLAGQMIDQSRKISNRWIVSIDGKQFPIMTMPVEDGYNIRIGRKVTVRGNWNIGRPLLKIIINERKLNIKIERIRAGYRLTHSGISVDTNVRSPRVSELESLMPKKVNLETEKSLIAPLAGQVIGVHVSEGDDVVIGQELVTLTAMKMENIIKSEHNTKVKKIFVSPNENVAHSHILMEFE